MGEEQAKKFLVELRELLARHGLTDIGSCGCCSGVYVSGGSPVEAFAVSDITINKDGATATIYIKGKSTEVRA